MELEDMIYEIERFIDCYDGTAIGQSIKNWLDNTDRLDYDEIQEIYKAVNEV